MRTIKKRRRQGKTDYRARVILLKSSLPRIVLRRSNRYFTAQLVVSKEAQDKVVIGVNSRSLLEYGWDKEKKGSLKSKQAAYLTGFLLGKKILDGEEKSKTILDLGLREGIAKSRIYAFALGLKDSGVSLKVKEEMFPEISKEKIDIERIKSEIEKKFV